MKRVLILLFSFFTMTATLFAQSFEFRVLANRGENTIKTKGSSQWTSLKTGSTIFAGSELKLGQGGYIGLMHKTGKTLEIKTPKVHSVDELSKSVLSKGSSVASQYGEFLMAKMSSSGGGDVSDEKLNNLNVTGAVSRAAGDDKDIQLFLPKTSRVLSFDDAMVKWNKIDGASDYVLEVENLYSENIASKKLIDNSFDLSELNVNLAEEGGVFLKVKAGTDSDSEPYAVEQMTGSEKDKILLNLKKLKSEIAAEDLAMQKLVLAMFYEDNKLYLHAFSCYHEILNQYPEEDFYKSAYLDFVERNKDKF